MKAKSWNRACLSPSLVSLKQVHRYDRRDVIALYMGRCFVPLISQLRLCFGMRKRSFQESNLSECAFLWWQVCPSFLNPVFPLPSSSLVSLTVLLSLSRPAWRAIPILGRTAIFSRPLCLRRKFTPRTNIANERKVSSKDKDWRYSDHQALIHILQHDEWVFLVRASWTTSSKQSCSVINSRDSTSKQTCSVDIYHIILDHKSAQITWLRLILPLCPISRDISDLSGKSLPVSSLSCVSASVLLHVSSIYANHHSFPEPNARTEKGRSCREEKKDLVNWVSIPFTVL